MNEHMDNPNPDDIPEPTPPQEPTPMQPPSPPRQPEETAPAPEQPQETVPPPEYDQTTIPPQQATPQAQSPQPPATGEPDKDAKMWGMFCHLAGLAGYLPVLPLPIGNIFGPLILWLIKKDEIPFVDDQGKEALNFQISISIYMLVSFLLCLVFIGFVLAPAVVIFNLVMIIISSIESNKGVPYRYPLCLRLIK